MTRKVNPQRRAISTARNRLLAVRALISALKLDTPIDQDVLETDEIFAAVLGQHRYAKLLVEVSGDSGAPPDLGKASKPLCDLSRRHL